MLTDIETTLGTFWVHENESELQIGIRDVQQVSGPPGDGVYRWNLNMVEVLRDACDAVNAQMRVSSPGGYRITPGDQSDEIIEKLREFAEMKARGKPRERWTKPL